MELKLYFDYKSPYAYLAIDPTRAMAASVGVAIDWRPFTLDIPSYLGSAKLDKKPVVIIGDITYIAFFCSPYLMKIMGLWPELESPFYIPLYVFTTGFLAHFGIAAAGPLTGSMLGDITDQDELEYGRRREGLIFGAESFTWKALTGLGPLGAGIVIDLVGLSEKVAPEDVQPELVASLGLAQGSFMLSLFIIAVFFISRYDLNRERHRQIVASLDERARVSLRRGAR